MRPWVVAFKFEVLVAEAEDVLHVRINLHHWQWTRLTGDLQSGLAEMVKLEMGVASGVDEISWLEACHLSHHLQQQGVACNVERNAKESVG